MLRGIAFSVFYPLTAPGMILLSTCSFYPCAGVWGGMDGDDEEKDENYAKMQKLFEHIGINPIILSL